MVFVNNSAEFSLVAERERNGTCLLPIDFKAMMITQSSIYSVLLIASLIGNSLLIFASLKSNIAINLLIGNIAASDLVLSVVLFPREIVSRVKESTAFLVRGWIGSLLCKISAFTADVTVAVSTLSLILIASDRLVAVVFPFHYRGITVKKRLFLILSTWILAMAIHSPYFYTFRLDTFNGETFCISNWEAAFNQKSTQTAYYTALLLIVLIVPLITVCILQTITLLKLRDDKMGSSRTSTASQRHKERNNVLLKMSVVITLAFALCWLPFIALLFLLLYFPSSVPNCSLGFTIFNQFASLFSFFHCIVNPCICFTFIRQIRVGLKFIRCRV